MTEVSDTERGVPTNTTALPPFRLMQRNLIAVPSLGWHVACHKCGHNLTGHHGEYVAWHDGPDMSGVECDVDSWAGEECPSCGIELGDHVEDDDDVE